MAKSSKQVLQEARRLAGLAPKYESMSVPFDGAPAADVASKEYDQVKFTKPEGGDVGAGTGEKSAKVGGFAGGPGLPSKMIKKVAGDGISPGAHEPKEVGAGGGDKSPSIGGHKGGPGQTDQTKNTAAAEKEGAEVGAGTGDKDAKAGGSKPSKAKDDGLRSAAEEAAEYRELRASRMYEIVSALS
jgi:hypothetical protein